MKVKEFIAELQKYAEDAEVFINTGYPYKEYVPCTLRDYSRLVIEEEHE